MKNPWRRDSHGSLPLSETRHADLESQLATE